jgi:hypothetical protein
MTMKRTAVLGVMALVILAACAKKAPPAASDDEEASPPARAASPPAEPASTVNLAEKAAGMLSLIATAPECQKFRDQLEAVAKAPQGPAPLDDMARIVEAAHEAGCSRKFSKP